MRGLSRPNDNNEPRGEMGQEKVAYVSPRRLHCFVRCVVCKPLSCNIRDTRCEQNGTYDGHEDEVLSYGCEYCVRAQYYASNTMACECSDREEHERRAQERA